MIRLTSLSLNPDPAMTTAMANPRPERYHGKPAPEEGAGFSEIVRDSAGARP